MPTSWPNAAAFFRPTILLALALMAVILMMVLPVPAFLLDIGIALSFALAILMLTVTLFIERPLEFSAFPTILLASLMLRLSLNVSSTKLIIGNGHTGTGAAGHVIEGFAEFIMGGNLLLGLVVFCVLLIVNFVVTIFLTSEFGFSISPNRIAPFGAASTHAGILPTASLSVQKVHFSTTPFERVGYSLFSSSGLMALRGSTQLKLLAPYGQPAMQKRQPMQRCMSCMVMPFFSLKVALVGQTRTQGGFSQ